MNIITIRMERSVLKMRSSVKTHKLINHLHETERRWFAVYTKYRAEKYIVDQLKDVGIEAYIPLLKKMKRYASKIKISHIPLISSYVFVRIKRSDYLDVLNVNHVFEFVKQRNNLISIPGEEIEILKKIVGEECQLSLAEEAYSPGDKVEVISGNLTGLKGRSVANKGKQNVLIELENIGFQFLVEVDRSLLVKIG